jgi:hypothetical protein
MSDSEDDVPVFNYVASIQNREFIVTIAQNRMSQWDDLSSCTLDDRLQNEEPAGSIISVRISEEIYLKALEMVEKEKLEEARIGQFQVPAGETAKDIAEMDRLFYDFFWREVNPRLRQPLIQEAS